MGGRGKTMASSDFVDAPRRIFVAPPSLKICRAAVKLFTA
jgi:hypothetical protein